MDHNAVQKLINEFAKNAGVTRHLTTHSFRRGGAQYRFMFCPIGQRWSLEAIRWWGGWAQGEHVRHVIQRCSHSAIDSRGLLTAVLRKTPLENIYSTNWRITKAVTQTPLLRFAEKRHSCLWATICRLSEGELRRNYEQQPCISIARSRR